MEDMQGEDIVQCTVELEKLLVKDKTEIGNLRKITCAVREREEFQEAQQGIVNCDVKVLRVMNEAEAGKQSRVNSHGYTEAEQRIQEAITKSQKHQDCVAQERASLVQQLEAYLSEENDLQAERDRIENTTTRVLPDTRYELNLYNTISRIRWQYDCNPDEVNGYVSRSTDVKAFTLNKKQYSMFFITNYLWNLIDEGVEQW